MGSCYSRCINTIRNQSHGCCRYNNSFEPTQVFVPLNYEYQIILKVPHGRHCFQTSDSAEAWEYKEDVNESLKHLYHGISLTHWIVYNDETPMKTSSSGAHAKGILAWNDEIITWLVHSAPKFPIDFDGTDQFTPLHHSELEYGQSFVFMKIHIGHLENILNQLFIMHPTIYISNVNYEKYNKLYKNSTVSIYKISEKLHHVAKSPHYHKDLYEDIVLPKFGGCCYTETWVRGHQCCDTDQCKMIQKIKWNNDIIYSYTHDHSKFCYSDNGWVMISDINRMTTQFKRGGGGIIIQDKQISQLFKGILQI